MMTLNYVASALLLLNCYGDSHALDEQSSVSHTPIILVAGLGIDNIDMQPLEHLICKYLPDAYVRQIRIEHGNFTSFWNLERHAHYLTQAIYEDPQLRHGFHMIAFSQGGLSARFYIERFNLPPVKTYISLATPQRGIYRTVTRADPNLGWLSLFEPYITHLLYTILGQQFLSVANYWHDPLQEEQYLRLCRFLPVLNNEIEHEHRPLFKEHFTSLEQVILMQALCDEIVDPLISTHFGFYVQGSDDTIESLFESRIYLDDTIGLRTLDQAHKLHFVTVSCTRTDLLTNEYNFVHNMLPYLQ